MLDIYNGSGYGGFHIGQKFRVAGSDGLAGRVYEVRDINPRDGWVFLFREETRNGRLISRAFAYPITGQFGNFELVEDA